jgi:hypothetical protein
MKQRVLDIYNIKNVKKIGRFYYEKLSCHPMLEKYRFVSRLNSDDYDYVTERKCIELLNHIFKKSK